METEIKFCPRCGAEIAPLTSGYVCPKCGWGEGGSNDIVEIPFGAHTYEPQHWEYTIPEGYTAEIKDGKVVVKKNESEDEKIRKNLIHHFKNKTKPYWNEIAVKDIIAYLEKQKGQKPLSPEDKVQHPLYVEGFEAGKEVGRQFENVFGKQEPVINIEHLKSYLLQYLQDASNREDDSEIEADTDKWARMIIKVFGGVEQKPAEWSEEDEERLEAIIAFITFENENRGFIGQGRFTAGDLIHWLKSLRPQKKYEWDETDKKQLLQIIEDGVTKSLCKKGFHFHFDEEYAKDLIEYICSFNPSKSHWKPSEEQMDALLNVAGAFAPSNK